MSCKCKDIPIPLMFVEKKLSKDRKSWFMDHHYKYLNGSNYNETTEIDYGSNDFIAMLYYFKEILKAAFVRLIFATYGDEGSPGLPDGDYANKLTILFTPQATVTDSIKDCYWIAPGGSFNPLDSLLDPAIASQWITNYENIQLKTFNKYVEHIAKNYDTKKNQYSDTRSVLYDMQLLTPFMTEISCQALPGVRIHFCAYIHDDHGNDNIIPKRLITHFGFIDGSGGDYFPEDHDQSCRPKQGMKNFYDNGQLCPPTNCP